MDSGSAEVRAGVSEAVLHEDNSTKGVVGVVGVSIGHYLKLFFSGYS